MTERRRLAAFSLVLRQRRWRQLSFDGAQWSLWPRAPERPALVLSRVQVAVEWQGFRWLRLRWSPAGWRRFWPAETHLLLSRKDHAAQWPLIGAALAQSQGREWLGRR